MNSLIEQAKRLKAAIENAANTLSDEAALNSIELFHKWAINEAYNIDDKVVYNNILYKVIQSHTSQANWTPEITPSLFKRVSIDKYPEWVQPVSSQDAYMKDDTVKYQSNNYISIIDNNVWQPDVYGWKIITK